ncbi:hypothetical protein BGZ46_002059 [Entomortierella lignicola]|nr:hypothetical protein BGZ46_002059 [Entomortierella lignicola]
MTCHKEISSQLNGQLSQGHTLEHDMHRDASQIHAYAIQRDEQAQLLKYADWQTLEAENDPPKVGNSRGSVAENSIVAGSSCDGDLYGTNSNENTKEYIDIVRCSVPSFDGSNAATFGYNNMEVPSHSTKSLGKERSKRISNHEIMPKSLTPSSINGLQVGPCVASAQIPGAIDDTTKNFRFGSDIPTLLSESRPSSWLIENVTRISAMLLPSWLPGIGFSNDVMKLQKPTTAGPLPLVLGNTTDKKQSMANIQLQELDKVDVTINPSECDSRSLFLAEYSYSSLSWSYFQPQSLGSAYRASIGSWYDSILAPPNASLLPTHNHYCEREVQHLDCALIGENINEVDADIDSAASVERIASLVLSTGRATLGYLTGTVASATLNFAQRGAYSTLEFISAYVHTVPRLAWPSGAEQGAYVTDVHAPCISNQDQKHFVYANNSEYNRSEMAICSDRKVKSMPAPNFDAGHQQSHASGSGQSWPKSSADLSIVKRLGGDMEAPCIIQKTKRSKNTPHHRRQRYPLQALPGPENLDPEIRRQLEEEGLSSLGLFDEAEARACQ